MEVTNSVDTTDTTDETAWSDMTTFWLENQVVVTLHSNEPFQDTAPQEIITSLRLNNLNQFLNDRGFTLTLPNPTDIPRPVSPDNPGDDDEGKNEEEMLLSRDKNDAYPMGTMTPSDNPDVNINGPRGKYLFPSPSDDGTVAMCFFRIQPAGMERSYGMQDLRMSYGNCCGNDSQTRQVVNLINRNLVLLRLRGKVPVIAAMPNWIGSGNHNMHCHGGGGPGCPPIPVPVEPPCSSTPGYWPIQLPDLVSSPLQDMTGKGVTVFVLDTMPNLTPNALLNEATAAGNNNLLLRDVAQQMLSSESPFIQRTYQTLPDPLSENAPETLLTGLDIYGQPYGYAMPDHGLFVTGIVRDVARAANIEYIRLLNDFGVFDTLTLISALQDISTRMNTGDLLNQPVVINLSLGVAPLPGELAAIWSGSTSVTNIASTDPLIAGLQKIIQSLVTQGAVIVAAAGNDSNNPAHPQRVGPRFPAVFPEVISVGAVDKCGRAASYSNYPALPPNFNGIATYGGAEPQAVPPISPLGPHVPTTATNIDSPFGLYSSQSYPALSADDSPLVQPTPNIDAWASWSGTSFATPIISGVAARILQKLVADNVPSTLWASTVQQAFTTANGQRQTLTGGQALPTQPEFSQGAGVGVSLLRAYQCSAPSDCPGSGTTIS